MLEKFLGNRIVGVWMTPDNLPDEADRFYNFPARMEEDLIDVEWKETTVQMKDGSTRQCLWPYFQGIKLVYDEEE